MSSSSVTRCASIGGGTYEQEFTDDGRPADCWVFEDLVYIHKRHVRGGRLQPRRDDDDADDLRRDAPRLLRPHHTHRGHDREPHRRVAVLPVVPPVLRADLHRGGGPRARRGLRLRLQRLDGRGLVRRVRRSPRAVDHRAAVGRAPRRRRGAPQRCRGAACRLLRGVPPHLGLPSIHSGYWDPFAACAETQTVVCMHIGS